MLDDGGKAFAPSVIPRNCNRNFQWLLTLEIGGTAIYKRSQNTERSQKGNVAEHREPVDIALASQSTKPPIEFRFDVNCGQIAKIPNF